MLDIKGNDLSNGSADYINHGNKEDFISWLREGLKEFKHPK